jgi:hypothetical protein
LLGDEGYGLEREREREREREIEARPRREGISSAGDRQVGMRELGIWQDAAT